jgi:hypothetical protein
VRKRFSFSFRLLSLLSLSSGNLWLLGCTQTFQAYNNNTMWWQHTLGERSLKVFDKSFFPIKLLSFFLSHSPLFCLARNFLDFFYFFFFFFSFFSFSFNIYISFLLGGALSRKKTRVAISRAPKSLTAALDIIGNFLFGSINFCFVSF